MIKTGNFFKIHMYFLSAIFVSLVYLTIAFTSGNLGIPHNDAWSHSRIAVNYATTGEIQLLGWNRSALVGQIFVLGVFGKSIVLQQIFVSLLSMLGLFAIYRILLEALGTNKAGIATLLITIWPGYALLTTSFMADMPMFSAIFMCLAIANHALKKDSKWLYMFSLVIGLWAFTIREQALAAPVAILLVAIYKRKELVVISKRILTISFFVFIAVLATFVAWRIQLPNSDGADFTFRDNGVLVAFGGIVRGWFNLALIIGIPVLFGNRLNLKSNRVRLSVLATFLLGIAALIYSGINNFFLPNYLNIFGSYAEALPPTAPLFPEYLWLALIVIAIVLGSLSAPIVFVNLRNVNPLVTTFTALTLIGTIGQFLTMQGVFDRYFIVFLPFLLSITLRGNFTSLLKQGNRISSALRIGVVTFIAAISMALSLHSWSFDIARWNLASQLVSANIPADRINAGLEWQGYNSKQGVVNAEVIPSWGFDYLFNADSCRVISSLDLDQVVYSRDTSAWDFVSEHSYPTYLYVGSSNLYVFDTNSAGCP
jgi:hypothetical protein